MLVPIQRRLVGAEPLSADVTRWRAQWLRGHLVWTAASLVFFVAAVIATVV